MHRTSVLVLLVVLASTVASVKLNAAANSLCPAVKCAARETACCFYDSCIANSSFCNGITDCPDLRDEFNCRVCWEYSICVCVVSSFSGTVENQINTLVYIKSTSLKSI